MANTHSRTLDLLPQAFTVPLPPLSWGKARQTLDRDLQRPLLVALCPHRTAHHSKISTLLLRLQILLKPVLDRFLLPDKQDLGHLLFPAAEALPLQDRLLLWAQDSIQDRLHQLQDNLDIFLRPQIPSPVYSQVNHQDNI